MFILNSQKYDGKNNYVEVLGMPASGKTTLVGNMKKNNPGLISVNERIPKRCFCRQCFKLFYLLHLFMKSPRAFIRDTNIILSSGQKDAKCLYSALSNWHLIVQSYSLHDEEERTYIWDQGLFQAVWSIYLCGAKEFNAIRLFENKLLPGKVYFTDVSNDELLKRSNNRGIHRRLNYLNRDEVEKGRFALEKTIQLLEQIGYTEQRESI